MKNTWHSNINPTPARFEHYRALQVLANDVRTLPAGILLPDVETSVA